MEQIGDKMEEHLKTNKDDKDKAYIKKIFSRFEELTSDKSCNVTISKRVKMLIKNMLDDRIIGWKKIKQAQQSGPMRVEELREKTRNDALQEE